MAVTVTQFKGQDGKAYELHAESSGADATVTATTIANADHVKRFLGASVSFSAAPTYTDNHDLTHTDQNGNETILIVDDTNSKAYIRYGQEMDDAAVAASVYTPSQGELYLMPSETLHIDVASAGGVIVGTARFLFEILHQVP